MSNTKLFRTDLPQEVWETLDAQAAREGLKIGTYLKRHLCDLAASLGGVPRDAPVTDAEWERLRAWTGAHPEVSYVGLTGRAEKMAHAVASGFVR